MSFLFRYTDRVQVHRIFEINKIKKMAVSFSSDADKIVTMPPIYILSKIEKLQECLTEQAFPDIKFKLLDLPDSFGKDPDVSKEFHNILKNVEIAVCDPDLLTKTHTYMPALKWAHSTWAGVEKLIKAIPNEPKFTVTRQSGERFSASIAEYVTCHILNNERLVKLCWDSQQSKTWLGPEKFKRFRTLDQITVGILGIGNMGNGIAKYLKVRGSTVIGLSRIPRTMRYGFIDELTIKLEDILPKCDYLINTLPSTPQTIGMLNNSVLENCIKKPVFINVGRGDIITEDELEQALRKEWLSGAVLDVFETEPLPTTSKLWKMKQVVITPHIAALSRPEMIADNFMENLTSYIDGHGLFNVVNWEAGY